MYCIHCKKEDVAVLCKECLELGFKVCVVCKEPFIPNIKPDVCDECVTESLGVSLDE